MYISDESRHVHLHMVPQLHSGEQAHHSQFSHQCDKTPDRNLRDKSLPLATA